MGKIDYLLCIGPFLYNSNIVVEEKNAFFQYDFHFGNFWFLKNSFDLGVMRHRQNRLVFMQRSYFV